MTEQQLLRIAVVVVLLLAVGCWPATQALAMGAAAAQAAPVGTLQADFNNDGDSDLGVGAPFEAVGAAFAAGAVSAVAESTGGLLGGGLLFTQDTAGVPSAAENEDFFGWALASGDSGPASTAASPSSATASSASRAQSGGGSLGRLFA